MRSLLHRVPLAALVLALFIIIPAAAFASATILIVNIDTPGEGFNDPAAWTPTGGNDATTLGQARLNAFQYAADIWGGLLNSTITIRVAAKMDPLTCTPSYAVLGSAGAGTLHRDFANAPLASTWYPQALANALAGVDVAPSNSDITATFNSAINGNPDCLGGASWYYGYDANPPGNDFDFVTVVLHELGHGLGFQSFMNLVDGTKFNGFNDMYMVRLERAGVSPPDYPSMSNSQRVAANISDPDLRWIGDHVTYMIPGAGVTAGLNGNYIRLHAPNPLVPGSSVAHFTVDVTPDEIMEPAFTAPNHDPGLAVILMKDIGWELDSSVAVAFEQIRATPHEASVEVSWRFRADEPIAGFNVYRQRADRSVEDLINPGGLLPGSTREYTDTRVEPGQSYRYSVAVVQPDGGETRSPSVTVAVSRFDTELAQNRPNPFNPVTELSYRLGSETGVALRIFDLSGRLVRTLVQEQQPAGSYSVIWNGRDETGKVAPAGVYLGRLETDEVVQTRRLVLLK